MTQLTYPQQPVHHILKGSAKRYGERLVLINQEEHLTYEQLYNDSLKFARALVRIGIEKGDVVCVHLPNCSSFLIAYYGTLMSGATFTPANPLLSEAELSHQLNDARARVIITSNPAVSFEETCIEQIIYVGDEGVEGLDFKQLLQQEEASRLRLTLMWRTIWRILRTREVQLEEVKALCLRTRMLSQMLFSRVALQTGA
ncbi:AMP-binding protein [Geomicrobium sp. JCM 19038]|uniref:AMP-binding protein n=1 Tax=Geomicrobium sp. JCM 19038 TaxID=1460635 RepID=UPI00045F3D69|nr:AMP-binding protein [Geomicrobium sp. JCM 19038]GAK07959.1 long-chain-fatty-acid-CoA ligase [Geomicrobium sp. JCM 19038]